METKTEVKSEIQTLEIYQCEIINLTETVKEMQHNNNPHKRMIITSLITSLETTQSQLRELINELKEKP